MLSLRDHRRSLPAVHRAHRPADDRPALAALTGTLAPGLALTALRPTHGEPPTLPRRGPTPLATG